ncbi:MAG: ABC transporter substrate-binding protein [Mycetocola sp.]
MSLPTRSLPLAALAALSALALVGCTPASGAAPSTNDEGLTSLVIAEPVHNLGYLPLYVAIDEGIFEKNGLDVSVTTQSSGGGAHVNAVLGGQAWGYIGGPEHNGFVKAQDGAGDTEIKAIANVVNRGNVYMVAREGVDAPEITSVEEAAAFLEGQKIVTGAYGGTPNSILRYILDQGGLTTEDVSLTESADPAAPIAIVSQGQADFALVADPIVTQGVEEGIWQEPFMSVPAMLGDYAYSTINVPVSAYSEGDGPDIAQAFVDSITEALALVNSDRELAEKVATAQFSNLDPDVIASVLDKAYADGLWPENATVTEPAADLSLAVARGAGALDDADDPATYADVVDLQFVDGQ